MGYGKRHEIENFHRLLDEIKSPFNCPAMAWKIDYDNGDGDFDEEMLPLLIQLNNDKWHTVSSCAGHTQRMIKAHFMSYGVPIPYRIVVYIHVSAHHINEFKAMVNELDNAIKNYFGCSLGYQDDYSNITEEGFVPFIIIANAGTKKTRDSYLNIFPTIAKKYNQ